MKKIIYTIIMLMMFIPICHADFTDDIRELRTSTTFMIDDPSIVVDGQIPSEYSFALGKNSSIGELSNYVELSDDLRSKIELVNNSSTAQYILSHEESSQAVDSIKGKYSILYKNVDIYNNMYIDVKMTVMDFGVVGIYSGGEIIDPQAAALMFRTSEMGIYSIGIRWVTIKYEFFKSGTNEPVSLKGNTTYWDIDSQQGVVIHDNNKGIYGVSCNNDNQSTECKLYSSHKDGMSYIFTKDNYNDLTDDRRYSFSEIFEGDSLTRTFQYGSADTVKWTSNAGLIHNSSKLSFPTELTAIQKYTLNDKVNLDDDITFTLNQQIPLILPQFYYKNLTIEDELDSVLDFTDLSILNELGEDSIDQFTMLQENNKIILTAKNTNDSNFYGHTYIIKISAKINKDKINKVKKDNKHMIYNNAITKYTNYNDDLKSLTSNEVKVTYEDVPEIVNVADTGISNIVLIALGFITSFYGIYLFLKEINKECFK